MPIGLAVKRVAVAMIVGMILAGIMSEVSFRVLKRENRDPQQIQIVIPAGTAKRVAAGQAPPSIPANMNFVVGDTLVVTNQDSVDHKLGPMWIPPGTSASLKLQTAQSFSYECSFEPSKFLGIDVQEAVTTGTRAEGILLSGTPLGMLLALYSLLLQQRKPKAAA